MATGSLITICDVISNVKDDIRFDNSRSRNPKGLIELAFL